MLKQLVENINPYSPQNLTEKIRQVAEKEGIPPEEVLKNCPLRQKEPELAQKVAAVLGVSL